MGQDAERTEGSHELQEKFSAGRWTPHAGREGVSGSRCWLCYLREKNATRKESGPKVDASTFFGEWGVLASLWFCCPKMFHEKEEIWHVFPSFQPGAQENRGEAGSTLVASYGSGDSDEEDNDSEESKQPSLQLQSLQF